MMIYSRYALGWLRPYLKVRFCSDYGRMNPTCLEICSSACDPRAAKVTGINNWESLSCDELLTMPVSACLETTFDSNDRPLSG